MIGKFIVMNTHKKINGFFTDNGHQCVGYKFLLGLGVLLWIFWFQDLWIFEDDTSLTRNYVLLAKHLKELEKHWNNKVAFSCHCKHFWHSIYHCGPLTGIWNIIRNFASIMLDSFFLLSCSKFCLHNVDIPDPCIAL